MIENEEKKLMKSKVKYQRSNFSSTKSNVIKNYDQSNINASYNENTEAYQALSRKTATFSKPKMNNFIKSQSNPILNNVAGF